jgi:membrane protease YdiL (CAAX protease family)
LVIAHIDTIKRVRTFVAIVFALSLVLYIPTIAAGTIDAAGGIFILVGMWVPATAALITARLHREPVRSLGWRPGKPRILALAYLLPVAYAALTYGVVWLVGAGSFTGDWPASLPILLVVGTISGTVTALGEELGWRGYLVPHLTSAYGFTAAAIVSGLIWSLWHYPLLLFTDYGTSRPRWYMLLCFTLFAVGLSFPLAWLRLRAGSVWPAALLHASHNLFVLNVFAPLMAEGRARYPLTGEGGLLLAIVGIALATVFWLLRDRIADRGAPATGAARSPAHQLAPATIRRAP